jgi:hypothetical protein
VLVLIEARPWPWQQREADMKTQFIALIALLAASPAGASVNTSEAMRLEMTPQPVAFDSDPAVEPISTCGRPQQMLFILRDVSGAIVAMGVAEAPAAC